MRSNGIRKKWQKMRLRGTMQGRMCGEKNCAFFHTPHPKSRGESLSGFKQRLIRFTSEQFPGGGGLEGKSQC